MRRLHELVSINPRATDGAFGSRQATPRFLLLMSLALLLVHPAMAAEHDPDLIEALSHFHQNPPDDLLESFEPGLRDSLLEIIDDHQVPRLARLRAVHALGRYGRDDLVLDRLGDIALDVEGDVRLRLAVVGTLGHRMGEHPKTVELLGEVLGDPDPGVRARAVSALSNVGGTRAEELLSRHRMVEMHVLVRRALRAALESRLGEDLPPEGMVGPRKTTQHARPVDALPVAPGTEEGLR